MLKSRATSSTGRQLKFWMLLVLSLWAGSISAQTTQFTYQGKLSNNGVPANGSYDFQFSLYDTVAPGAGTQLGATLTITNLTVSAGTFTAQLDFGACPACFNGADRFLEIAVMPTNGGAFTTLNPRQQVISTPYAVRSLAAAAADGLSVACINCVTSSQIASVNASAVTGILLSANIPPDSGNYVQNTTNPQATSNFNISGNGTAAGTLSAGTVNAVTQFNFAGNRVLGISGGNNQYLRSNLFAGVDTGTDTTPAAAAVAGNFNSFFGTGAGRKNMTGSENSFFGAYAGYNNLTGQGNSYFGDFAGNSTTSGNNNSFFGSGSGYSNTTGTSNAFFGQQSGNSNTTGNDNSFFGMRAGLANQTAGSNSFFGQSAGEANTVGGNNSFFGAGAGKSNIQSDSNSFFGAGAGFNSTGGYNNFFGVGAGQSNLAGSNNSFFGYITGILNTTGIENTFIGNISGYNNITGNNNVMLGYGSDFRNNPATGGGIASGDGNLYLGYQAGGAITRRNSTAIGRNAFVACDDCAVLGDSTVTSYKVGVGTNSPAANLHIKTSSPSATSILVDNSTAGSAMNLTRYGSAGGGNYFSSGTPQDSANTSSLYAPSLFVLRATGGLLFSGSATSEHMRISNSGNVSIGTSSASARLTVDATGGTIYTHSTNGYALHARSELTDAAYFEGSTHFTRWITVDELGTAGGNNLCWNASHQISACSSSVRYKTNVESFNGGLSIINRLRPISFDWKQDGSHDLGLAAEEVAKVEPLLTLRNANGEIEGVKYSQLSAVFINAFKEQQAQIERQHEQIEQQRAEIELLKQYLCTESPSASFCQPAPK